MFPALHFLYYNSSITIPVLYFPHYDSDLRFLCQFLQYDSYVTAVLHFLPHNSCTTIPALYFLHHNPLRSHKKTIIQTPLYEYCNYMFNNKQI